MAAEIKDGGLKKLEYLSLVSKVCTELESHLGFGDKVLAEFITELGRDCQDVDEFDKKLKDNGAEMPDYFVRTLLKIIHAILPPKLNPKSEKVPKKDDSDGKKTKFPALNISDGRERVKELEREIAMKSQEKSRRGYDDDEQALQPTDREQDRDRDKDRERTRYRDRHGDNNISPN